MSNYGWTNEAGEPIMDGAAWRFEQQLDLDAQADYYADHAWDAYDPGYDECEDEEHDCNDCNGPGRLADHWRCAHCDRPCPEGAHDW